MAVEFKGSLLVYLFLSATNSFRFEPRRYAALVVALYFLILKDPQIAAFFLGVWVAACDIDHIRICESEVTLVALTSLAFILMSFPSAVERTMWSRGLSQIVMIYGDDISSKAIASRGFGCTLLLTAIRSSPNLKAILSQSAFVWLGKVSFCLYLLHVPLLFSIGINAYTVFAGVWKFSEVASWIMMATVWIPISVAMAIFMQKHIDQPALKFSKSLETYFGDTEEE